MWLPTALLAIALCAPAWAGHPHKVRPKHPQLARVLKPVGEVFVVCGSDDLVATSRRFPRMFHPGESGPGYLLKGIPTRDAYFKLARRPSAEDVRPALRELFMSTQVVTVPRDFSAATLSGPPGQVDIRMEQSFGECLAQGPRGFSCGQDVPKAACCEGIFKMVGITLLYKDLELSFRPGSGTFVRPRGDRSKAAMRYCILGEDAVFHAD